MRFRTVPADHDALQAEIDAELAAGGPPGRILTWMTAHGASWLETFKVLGEEDYPDFESEPPTNRAAVRIQDRLAVVSPGEPYQWLSARHAELGRERPLDLLERGRAAPVLILLDEHASWAPEDSSAREAEAIRRADRWARSVAERRGTRAHPGYLARASSEPGCAGRRHL